jgi:hypothetical protein
MKKIQISATILVFLFSVVGISQVTSTPWQLETQARLDEAGRVAALQNKSVTVQVDSGQYEFVSLSIPGNVRLQFGTGGASREGDLIYVGDGDSTLITLQSGYATSAAGFQLRTKRGVEPNLIGIDIRDVINGGCENVRVDLRGTDTVGLRVAGRESLVVSKAEFRASVPVLYEWGDNIAFHDLDLGCNSKGDKLKNACVLFRGMPHQVVFDGSQTWQGGEHAVFGEISTPSSGQGLNLYNLRYEQSTSTQNPNKAAIHLWFTDRKLENLLIVGARWTDRKNAMSLLGITQITTIGSRLPGTK